MRYRLCRRDLPGKPDIVFPKQRVAVFVDGDFWHGGQWVRRGLRCLEEQFERSQSDRRAYWLQKIRSNMARDAKATAELSARGWRVLRFWASDVHRCLEGCVSMTIDALAEADTPSPSMVAGKSFADFFAGIGLMELGLEQEGWSASFSNDIDPEKFEMYRAHFGEENAWRYRLADVHRIDAETVPSVTLATASFPCTDLSLAGGRDGLAGKQSSAFWGFIRVMRDMERRRPPFVLLENVPGLLTSKGGRDFEDVLRMLNELGYAADAFMIDAIHFVPQSRCRLFVIGVPEDMPDFGDVHDEFWSAEGELRPPALARFVSKHPDVRWRVRRLPPLPERQLQLEDVIEDLPEDAAEWWSERRATYLLNQMSPAHRARADEMIAGENWSYGTVFRRTRSGKSRAELRTDGVAGCLRTPKGGSARQILFAAGRGRYRVRLLTPRENARLMGADDYRITVPLNQALFGFGDAVCVPVISWIARHYLNPLVNEWLRARPANRVE